MISILHLIFIHLCAVSPSEHHFLLSSLNHLFLLIYNNKLFLSSKTLSRNLRAFSRHHRFDLKILYVYYYFYCFNYSIFCLVIGLQHFMGPVKIFDWTKKNVWEKGLDRINIMDRCSFTRWGVFQISETIILFEFVLKL